MDDNTNLITFKAICMFIKDLADVYGAKHVGLQLYNRLVEKTTIMHEKPVAKHVETFQAFCVANRAGILALDLTTTPCEVRSVTYSEKVTFDIVALLEEETDPEAREAIYRHLLTILYFVDPESSLQAKLALNALRKKEASSSQEVVPAPPTTSEGQFINDLIASVEKTVDPSKVTNPLEAVQTVLSSGVFTEMLGKMQQGMASGQLNIGKLMGAMSGMMGDQGSNLGDIMGMMNLGAAAGNGGGVPDVMSLLSAFNGLSAPPK